jgi:acetolactate decarboxylase
MKTLKIASFFIILLVIAGLTLFGHPTQDKDTLYQVSVLNGLMKGDYDGKVTLAEIRRHGDFGIGTFDKLDGEEIELDNAFYQVRSDGTVRKLSGSVKVPFSMNTFFGTDMGFSVTRGPDYVSLQRFIDTRLPSKNIPYAIKIDGKFSYIKARSVPAQSKPYPPLTEVVKSQSVFEFKNIEGTLVGFRIPDYMRDVNILGYHLHFISRDRAKGGHLLECAIDRGDVKIDSIDRFIMALPRSQDFYRLDLSRSDREAYKTE